MYRQNRLFHTFLLCVSFFCSFNLQAQRIPGNLPDQLSNQIIIQYERSGGRSARGKEITSEHQELIKLLASNWKVAAKHYKPVFPRVVNQMVSDNLTETEWQRNTRAKLGSKPGKGKRQFQTGHSKLSSSITLKLDGDPREVEMLIRRINEESLLFQEAGFKNVVAEPVRLMYMSQTPNDPLYASQWSHQVADAAAAWDAETGDAGVVIAIIDSGVDPHHEDLSANILSNGRDFVNINTEEYEMFGYGIIAGEDYTTEDNDPSDYNGHGTHVAGIAAGSGNNGKGIAGVCHSCSVLPVRAGFSILFDNTEYGVLQDDAIANAIVYATDNGADVINMSFGGRGSVAMKNAIDYAHSQGVVLVAAAGNSASSGMQYPAGYENVIAVASSDDHDGLSWYSNYGNWIDVVAPGQSIISTVPASGGAVAHPSGYRSISGTSMAAPYVAGLAGLIKSKNPALTGEEIAAVIISTTDNIDAGNPDHIGQMGYGRVNAGKALNNTPAPNILFNGFSFTELTGNQNGHINPGEQISLVVSLKNTWTAATAVTATLSTSDPYVTVAQNAADYQGIPMGSEESNASNAFVFTADAAIPDNHTITFNLAINSDGELRNVTLKLAASVTDRLEVPGTYPTIQAAINAASSGDEIVVSPGIYYENINFIGKHIALVSLYHSTGDPAYIETTIIDGSRPTDIRNASTVTFRNGENSSTLLSGFTIRGGTGTYTLLPESPFYNYFGGGILSIQASPVLENLIIRDNTLSSSNGSGGGILISHGSPTLRDLLITENRMSAGLYIVKVNNPGSVIAQNVRVIRSINADGIYVSSSHLALKNITVEDCTGSVAVGLFSIYSTLEVDGAAISGNNRGADVRACDGVILRNAAITNNGIGGGIWCTSTALQLINTTVAGNRLTNHYGGAGIFITDNESKITLVNSIQYHNLWTEYNTGIVRENSISFLNDGGELTAAYSNVQGGQAGLKFFNGSSNITVNWLDGNMDADPLFFKPENADYHLSSGSPSAATGIVRFEHNGTLFVDLKPGEYEGTAPDMGAYLFNQPYLRSAFTANKTQGNAPMTVQFTDGSYSYKTTPHDTWAWDFGDGATATTRNPVHQYTATGAYTVKLKITNGAYLDEEISIALIKVYDSDTLYVATSGSNTTGTGAKNKPFKTIQHGINVASDDDVVIVANGLYRENLDFSGKDVRVSSYYRINNDPGHVAATIIDGSVNGRVATFDQGEGPNAGLYGMTLQNGYANGSNYPTYEGGGIYVENSSPALIDLVIKNNKSNYRGGGIFIKNGDPALERVTVSSNEALGDYSPGGGIYMEQSKSLMKDVKILSNTTRWDGGGILLGYRATPDMQGVTIMNNKANNGGGGVHIESNNLQLSGMYIKGNTGGKGGGIHSSFSNSIISHSVIAGNTATVEGGGFYYLGNSANPALKNATVYNNTSPNGREIRTGSLAKVYVANAIIWNTNGAPVAGTVIATYSDISGGLAGTGNINADPRLLDPANDNYSLDVMSPCIDAGDPTMTDPNGTIVDMGAFPYDRPIITGAVAPVVIAEDGEKSLSLTNLVVKNTASDYPASYSVVLGNGAHYTISGNVVKPEPNYHGSITVPVTITDNKISSQVFALPVTVTPVNDAPEIAAQQHALELNEGGALAITLADLIVTDIDNTSQDLVLKYLPGAAYTVAGSQVTPVADYTGALTVQVVVSDGTDDSDPFDVTIDVLPVNDAPVVSGQEALEMDEDSELTITLEALAVTDVDNVPAEFTLKVLPGTNYTVSGSQVAPVADYDGTLTVPVVVSDGTIDSNPFNITIEVLSVNDAPVVSALQPSLEMYEDGELVITAENLTIEDVDNTPADFVVKVLPGMNYSAAGGRIVPRPDYHGALTVAVVVNDGADDSESIEIHVNVSSVNDVPMISAQRQLLEMNEDSRLTVTLDDLMVADVDNAPAELVVKVLPGAGYTVSGNQVVPAADFNGPLNVSVVINDDIADSDPFNVSVRVLPVNDAPEILRSAEFTIEHGTALRLTMEDVEVKDIDNQTGEVTFSVLPGANYTVAGNTIQPIADFSGALQVGVQVNDGTAVSEVHFIVVNVTPVTGLETTYDRLIEVYPNPAQDYVFVKNPANTDILDIRVISSDGRPVNARQISGDGGTLLTVSHLASGNYFVQVRIREGVILKRVAIIR